MFNKKAPVLAQAPAKAAQAPGGTRRKTKNSKLEGDVTEDNGFTMATVDGGANNEQPDPKRPKKPSEVAMENFILALSKKQIEGLKTEFKELQTFKPPADLTANAFIANKEKNRYFNVLCYDKTRVVLNYHVPPDSDYINANYVASSLATLTNKYICTQGPIETTVNDFWRMIWQEKVKNIVMLCGTVENGKAKCAQYYPLADETKLYGTITVSNKRNTTAATEKIYESILLEVQADGFAEPIQLTLMRWLDWPDFGIPQSGMGMLRIMKTIRDAKESSAVIHCSAGIGRTGTIMACEICLRVLLEGKELSVPEVVKDLRCQRAGSIQTESQYIYLHRALAEYIHAKRLQKDEIARFFVSFAEYRKSLVKPEGAKPDNQLPIGSPAPRPK